MLIYIRDILIKPNNWLSVWLYFFQLKNIRKNENKFGKGLFALPKGLTLQEASISEK